MKSLIYEEKDIQLKINNEIMQNYSIHDFHIYSSPNTHTYLNMSIEISEEEKEKYEVINQIENCIIEINFIDDNNTKNKINIFNGIIERSEFKTYGNNGYKFILIGYSKSILLDRNKKYRVFQDIKMSYEEIINEILLDYKNEKIKIMNCEKSKNKINGLIVQFNETDFEFLVRIASRIQSCILITNLSIIDFGFINNTDIIEDDMKYSDYSIIRNRNNIIYNIKSPNIMNTGNNVVIKTTDGENTFTIIKSRIDLIGGHFFGEYDLVKDNYQFDEIKNNKIKGNVIECKVEKVFEKNNIAYMNVLFYDGLKKYGIAYKDYGISRFDIPYSTFYSQTNTGFFCTPEINDIVDALFLNEEEDFVRINGSINNPGNGRFSDYTKRNFHINTGDFNMNIDLNKINIVVKKDYKLSAENISCDANNIISQSYKTTAIASDDYMGVESLGDMSIYANKIDIIGKEEEVVIESSKSIRLKGEKIHNN